MSSRGAGATSGPVQTMERPELRVMELGLMPYAEALELQRSIAK